MNSPFIHKENALEVNRQPTFEEFESQVGVIDQLDDGINFYWGDLVLLARGYYPQTWTQLFPEKKAKTLTNRAWVASRIPPRLRRKGPSWSHYMVLAGIEDHETIKELIDRVIEEELTVTELKDIVKPGSRKPRTVVCPECGAKFEL